MKKETRSSTIYKALRKLIKPGDIAELRVPENNLSTLSGIFDDLRKMAKAASSMDATGCVFATLNPLSRSSEHKVTNTLAKVRSAVKDRDIARRLWLLLDFDPIRPSNKPSTTEERGQTLQVAQECRDFLSERGWPPPILASSGNGYHLLYPIDLPNDEAICSLIQNSLEGLSLRFSDDRTRLDTSTANASRLVRVYGTANRKGKAEETRPHRRSRLRDVPSKLVVVTKEKLEAISANVESIGAAQASSITDVDAWLLEHDVPVEARAEWNKGGRKWILEQCPWNLDHHKSAFIVQFRDGGTAAGCLHNSCAEKKWPDLRAIYERAEQAGSSPASKQSEQKATQTSQLIEVVKKDISLFCTPQGESYATVRLENATKNVRVDSDDFRRFLRYRHFNATETSLRSQTVQEAILHFDTLAQFESATESIFLRTGGVGGQNYLDLADDRGRAIEFSVDGWRVVENPPIRFRRVQAMLPLPLPMKGGDIQDFRDYLNISSDEDWLLYIAVVAAAIFPQGPYPILGIHGEAGCGKTTMARLSRRMVDPNAVPSRGLPKDSRDLMIAANNSWQLSFDNLSFLRPWFSDCLCQLSSGAGFSTRQLYTDSGEMLFQGQRPIVMNGIEELATRTDLLDRSVLIELPVIRKYRAEQEFWAKFDAAQPELLGSLLDLAVGIMQRFPKAEKREQLRMADFARLGAAAESSLGFPSGAFIRAYSCNRQKANAIALDASPIANLICELAENGSYEGTATALLQKLDTMAGDELRKRKSWPKSPNVLSGMLKRLNTALRTTGVELEFARDDTKKRNRIISLRKLKTKAQTQS